MIASIDQITEENIKKLPSTIQAILADKNTITILNNIGIQNEIKDEIVLEMLEDEVIYVLVGLNYAEDLKDNLIWNLRLTESKAENIAKKIDTLIFADVHKFLKHKIPTSPIQSPLSTQISTKQPVVVSATIADTENLNHVDILQEIESPSPSLKPIEPVKPTAEKEVSAIQTMPKEAQKLMSKAEISPIEITSAPSLQDAVSNMMPAIGGFKAPDNPLKPAQKVSTALNSKLDAVQQVPVKEVYVPKKIDPYREPAL